MSIARGWIWVPSSFLVALALAAVAVPQGVAARAEAPALQTWLGRVCRPDGSPAPGAVVVTSAGGRAVAAADGSFTLALELPRDAAAVEVTATLAERAGPALVATARLVPAASGSEASLGLLQLQSRELAPPDWRAGFGERPGMGSSVGRRSLAVFDDGNGPALYVCGGFPSAGGAATGGIARWDGERWSAVSEGIGAVESLAVFDDGNGPALYAGGNFTTIGGVPANRIARWDGDVWTALGSGVGGSATTVSTLAVFDDGNGPALFAGGTFTGAGGAPASRVARWDGTSWAPLGTGISWDVRVMTVFDDGTGPALHVGGFFGTAGGAPANNIAKWDGTSWSALGAGANSPVHALASFEGALYAGGVFDTAGGVAAYRVAKWDGSSWSALGSGLAPFPGGGGSTVESLAVFDDGAGPALFVGGSFPSAGGVASPSLARWDGTSWSAAGGGIPNAIVQGLGTFDDGNGPALYLTGNFSAAGDTTALGIARFDGASWSSLGNGLDNGVRTVVEADLGEGRALFAGGSFTSAGSATLNRVARWTPAGWTALESGTNDEVRALALFDDGSGRALYAGGDFTEAGGAPANRIAKWDGTSWSALGTGMTNGIAAVFALTTFDDGNGTALYAGGGFARAGGVFGTLRIARWDGSSWSALGGGMNDVVRALAVYDDGSGAALYAGGEFNSAGGVPASCIARWDGSSWSALGSGMVGGGFTLPSVHALAVHDDGTGPALYAGGFFQTAGGFARPMLARWDGTSWSGGTGGGLGSTVSALASHDDGTGPALYAGGSFTDAGGLAVNRVARFDGTTWSALGGGTSNAVFTLASTPRGLCVGGAFIVGPTAQSSFLANWVARRPARVQR